MKIRSEGNCSRKYRRLQTPLNISVCGQVCAATNWSPGGIVFEATDLQLAKDVPQPAELLLPCSDGVFSLPVQICPARQTPRGWGCKFLDVPRRESAILHQYADAIFHGFTVTIAELETAGRQHLQAEDTSMLEEPQGSRWALRTPLKRLLVVCALLALIAAVGSIAVPFFLTRVKSRLNEGDYYLKIAQSRLRTAQLSIDVIDAKIATTKELLAECSGPNPQVPIPLKEQKMLHLGLNQLNAERQMLDVHLGILQADVEAVKKGDFFFEQSVLGGYGTEHHTDPVPYLTEILADIAQDAKSSPRQTEDRQKYVLVAQDRVKQAQYQLHSIELQRQALEAIIARCADPAHKGALPENSLDLTRRDIALLDMDAGRLHDLLTLLEANLSAAKNGNFVFETNLLQRYDPDLMRPAPSTANSALTH